MRCHDGVIIKPIAEIGYQDQLRKVGFVFFKRTFKHNALIILCKPCCSVFADGAVRVGCERDDRSRFLRNGVVILSHGHGRADDRRQESQIHILDFLVKAGVNCHIGGDLCVQQFPSVVAVLFLVGKFVQRLGRQIAEDVVIGFHIEQSVEHALLVKLVEEAHAVRHFDGDILAVIA